MHAIDEVRADGVDFVFNTPNDKSRPGYLKMGWREVGRLPVAVRPVGVGGVRSVARARVAASHWPVPIDVGVPIGEVADELKGGVAKLNTTLDAMSEGEGLLPQLIHDPALKVEFANLIQNLRRHGVIWYKDSASKIESAAGSSGKPRSSGSSRPPTFLRKR